MNGDDTPIETAPSTCRPDITFARLKRIPDNDADYVDPLDMLAELRSDNQALITALREAHALCDDENDVATASLIEVWIDQAERRVWFLYETARRGAPGH